MKSRRFCVLVFALACGALSGCAGGPKPGPGLIADFTGTSPVEHYDIGFNRLLMGDEKGAEEAFRTSLKTAGKNGLDFAPPHEGMARLLLKKGKLEEAEAEASHALELDSHWTRAYWVLGKISEVQGRENIALIHYERALIYDPGDPEVTDAAVELLKRLNRGAEAAEVLKRSQELRARKSDRPRGVAPVGDRAPGSNAAPGGTSGSDSPPAPGGTSGSDSPPVSGGTSGGGSTPPPVSEQTARIQSLLEPFFPRTIRDLSPKLLAVFNQPHLTRGALAVLAVGDGEHVLARAFDKSVLTDEETSRAPRDTPGRPEETWIHHTLALGLMETLPDGTFRPDEPMSRQTMALWIEETIARLRNQEQVFALYRGEKSPFPDVPDGHFGLNAARIVVELGLIKPLPDGRFDPEALLSVEEGVEAVRNLAPSLMGE